MPPRKKGFEWYLRSVCSTMVVRNSPLLLHSGTRNYLFSVAAKRFWIFRSLGIKFPRWTFLCFASIPPWSCSQTRKWATWAALGEVFLQFSLSFCTIDLHFLQCLSLWEISSSWCSKKMRWWRKLFNYQEYRRLFLTFFNKVQHDFVKGGKVMDPAYAF